MKSATHTADLHIADLHIADLHMVQTDHRIRGYSYTFRISILFGLTSYLYPTDANEIESISISPEYAYYLGYNFVHKMSTNGQIPLIRFR